MLHSLSSFSFLPVLTKTANVVSNPQRLMRFPSANNYGRGKRNYIMCNKCDVKYSRGVGKSAEFLVNVVILSNLHKVKRV